MFANICSLHFEIRDNTYYYRYSLKYSKHILKETKCKLHQYQYVDG